MTAGSFDFLPLCTGRIVTIGSLLLTQLQVHAFLHTLQGTRRGDPCSRLRSTINI